MSDRLIANIPAITADLERFQAGADSTLDVENIRDLIFEVEQLRPEVERLRAETDRRAAREIRLFDERYRLEAEVEHLGKEGKRLRGIVNQLVDACDHDDLTAYHRELAAARAAMSQTSQS
jgi:chromosome segregation ATPase